MQIQKTIKQEVAFEGIGLHSGLDCIVKLHPAPTDHGIVFSKNDILIPVNIINIIDTSYATTIGSNGVTIQTVEHLLAALFAFNINNILIEVDGSEIPILDGSSLGYIEILARAGIVEQGLPMPYLKIIKPLTYSFNGCSVSAEPYDTFRISFRINFEDRFIGKQRLSIDISKDSFIREIAPSRTFGFIKEIDYLKSMGLANGASTDNALVFGDTGVLNKTGLRFPDECVRHKILDMIGDLSFISMPIRGHIIADKSGHSINIQFIKELLKNSDCWEIILKDRI